MRQMGLKGDVRGKTVRSTIRETAAPCPPDRVDRISEAPRPNMLWLSDLTDVATWGGFVYVAYATHAAHLR